MSARLLAHAKSALFRVHRRCRRGSLENFWQCPCWRFYGAATEVEEQRCCGRDESLSVKGAKGRYNLKQRAPVAANCEVTSSSAALVSSCHVFEDRPADSLVKPVCLLEQRAVVEALHHRLQSKTLASLLLSVGAWHKLLGNAIAIRALGDVGTQWLPVTLSEIRGGEAVVDPATTFPLALEAIRSYIKLAHSTSGTGPLEPQVFVEVGNALCTFAASRECAASTAVLLVTEAQISFWRLLRRTRCQSMQGVLKRLALVAADVMSSHRDETAEEPQFPSADDSQLLSFLRDSLKVVEDSLAKSMWTFYGARRCGPSNKACNLMLELYGCDRIGPLVVLCHHSDTYMAVLSVREKQSLLYFTMMMEMFRYASRHTSLVQSFYSLPQILGYEPEDAGAPVAIPPPAHLLANVVIAYCSVLKEVDAEVQEPQGEPPAHDEPRNARGFQTHTEMLTEVLVLALLAACDAAHSSVSHRAVLQLASFFNDLDLSAWLVAGMDADGGANTATTSTTAARTQQDALFCPLSCRSASMELWELIEKYSGFDVYITCTCIQHLSAVEHIANWLAGEVSGNQQHRSVAVVIPYSAMLAFRRPTVLRRLQDKYCAKASPDLKKAIEADCLDDVVDPLIDGTATPLHGSTVFKGLLLPLSQALHKCCPNMGIQFLCMSFTEECDLLREFAVKVKSKKKPSMQREDQSNACGGCHLTTTSIILKDLLASGAYAGSDWGSDVLCGVAGNTHESVCAMTDLCVTKR